MKNVINSTIITIIILFNQSSFAKECKEVDNTYSIYFINGVGNSSRDEIERSALVISKKVVINDKKIQVLRNPMNNQHTDWLKNKFGTPFTWTEIKEVFSQKYQESNNYEKIVDEKVVQEMYNSLEPDKVNLVIAHSQGNLYANSLCKLNNGRKKQKNIAIGTPAAVVECGDSTGYVTLDQDLVIKGLGTAIPSGSFKKPLKGNVSVSGCQGDFYCHNLVEAYLTEPQPLEKIKDLFNLKMAEITKEELDFNFIDLQLTQVNNDDKSLITNASEYIKESYSSVNLGVRRNIASFKTVSYLTEVFNSNFASSLLKLNLSRLSKKDFQKILDTEVSVSSDQEFADLVGYILDSLHPHCLSNAKFLPKNVLHVCKSYINYFTPLTFSESTLFEKFSLKNDISNWDLKDKKLSLNCLKFLEANEKNKITNSSVTLNYIPSKSVSTIKVQDLTYKVYPKTISNKAEEQDNILDISFYKEDANYKYKLVKLKDDVNFVKPIASNDYIKCNTLNKLFSNKCSDYFANLMKNK